MTSEQATGMHETQYNTRNYRTQQNPNENGITGMVINGHFVQSIHWANQTQLMVVAKVSYLLSFNTILKEILKNAYLLK